MRLWLAVVIACAGCAALKVAGFVVPARFLESRSARRMLEALPVTLLSALIAVSVFYLAIENLFGTNARRRWIVAFLW